jgi:hypothetical protein
MLVTAFGGGTAVAGSASTPPSLTRVSRMTAGRADLGLTVTVSTAQDDGLVVSATAGELSFRKTVYPDGRFQAQIEQGRDRVALAGSEGRLTVTYGSRSLTLSADQDAQQSGRVRELLVSSPALRLFRRLTAELEASGDTSPEILGLRLTGALVGEIDGDDGAVRRLSRELMTKFGGHTRKVRVRASCYDSYQALVLQASYQLEQCLGQFGLFNPMRQLCPFVWTLQVESAWFSFLGCSAVPLK